MLVNIWHGKFYLSKDLGMSRVCVGGCQDIEN